MNGFKHILTALSGAETAENVLKTAYLCARKFNGHMDAVHVRPSPSCLLPIPVVSSDVTGFVVSDIVANEESVYAKNARDIENLFDRFVRLNRIDVCEEPSLFPHVTAQFRTFDGAAEELAVFLSRVSDLTIMPRPVRNAAPNDDTFGILNAVLMETGAAVLLPASGIPETVGTKIAVEWNGTAEAAKAVTLAVPFLRKAKQLVIFETAELPEYGNAAALRNFLAWSGIKAQVVSLEKNLSSGAQGEQLTAAVRDGFDLLVMGAYTQSSMRRWILGSVTRYMIENADIALFLAH